LVIELELLAPKAVGPEVPTAPAVSPPAQGALL
jgi:hypothetical protein